MIFFVVPADGKFGIQNYQSSRWLDPDSPETAVVAYDELVSVVQTMLESD